MARGRMVTALQVVGGSAFMFAVVSVAASSAGTPNGSHEPGAETERWLSMQHPVHVFALAAAVTGAALLVVAWLLDSRR